MNLNVEPRQRVPDLEGEHMKNYYVSIIRRGEMSYIRSELEQFGLIPMEGRLIRLLKDHCFSQEELGESLDIDKGRIAKTVYMLEQKGIVSRNTNSNNRRQKLVSLTEEGERIYDAILDIYEAWDDICYRGFTEEERNMNHEFIKRISHNVVEYKKKIGGRKNG